MIKVILRLSAGTGMDSADAFLVSKEEWEAYTKGTDVKYGLSDYAWQEALQWAESFGLYPDEDRPDDWDEEEHDDWSSDGYTGDIEGYFELYDPKEHDGLLTGSSSEWDWKII